MSPMKKALIIIAREGFQDQELEGVRAGLTDGGFTVTIGSTEAGECIGKFGGREQATIAMRDVVVTDFDRIVFIGGPGAHELAKDFDALNVARTAADAGVLLGAICIAPTVLAAAGVLKGRRATVWDPSVKTGVPRTHDSPISFLVARGATYTGDTVTVDGKVVTGNGPEAAEEFGKTFAALL